MDFTALFQQEPDLQTVEEIADGVFCVPLRKTHNNCTEYHHQLVRLLGGASGGFDIENAQINLILCFSSFRSCSYSLCSDVSADDLDVISVHRHLINPEIDYVRKLLIYRQIKLKMIRRGVEQDVKRVLPTECLELVVDDFRNDEYRGYYQGVQKGAVTIISDIISSPILITPVQLIV